MSFMIVEQESMERNANTLVYTHSARTRLRFSVWDCTQIIVCSARYTLLDNDKTIELLVRVNYPFQGDLGEHTGDFWHNLPPLKWGAFFPTKRKFAKKIYINCEVKCQMFLCLCAYQRKVACDECGIFFIFCCATSMRCWQYLY